MSYLGFFGLEFEKNIVIFEISTLEFVELIKFAEKTEMPKFRRKNALFGYFWNIILKTIVVFEISTLKFVYLQNFTKNPKRINLEPKMPYLYGYCWGRNMKKLFSYFKSAPSNLFTSNFLSKSKTV